jgi:short-subunit dehydrogenase
MNIIVSGGSRGIGKEVALHLAKNKINKIIITGRNEKALQSIADTCEHDNIFYLVVDLANFQSQKESFRNNVTSLIDSIDILINNAGYLKSKLFKDSTDEEARTMMEMNFFAAASLMRTLLPLMKKGSHILNISSMGGFQGSVKFPGLSYYSASKAALACLSECLALEFEELEIKVNCLALGSVQTEMLEEAFPGYKAPIDAKKMGEFIADFASNGNKYFNGKIIPVALTNP